MDQDTAGKAGGYPWLISSPREPWRRSQAGCGAACLAHRTVTKPVHATYVEVGLSPNAYPIRLPASTRQRVRRALGGHRCGRRFRTLERWLLSYADLITTLMVFFLALYV
ncbi:hypothetical protein CA601_29270, partial [Paraburkholderia hospita]